MQRYENGVLVDLAPEEIAALEAEANAPVEPPAEVDMWRLRVILARTSHPDPEGPNALQAANALVATLPDEDQQRWEYAPRAVLASPLIQAFGPPLAAEYNTTVEDVFIEAAALTQ